MYLNRHILNNNIQYLMEKPSNEFLEQENELYALFINCLLTGHPMEGYTKPLVDKNAFQKNPFAESVAESAYKKAITEVFHKKLLGFQDSLVLLACAGGDRKSILACLPIELAIHILMFKNNLEYPSYASLARKFNFPDTPVTILFKKVIVPITISPLQIDFSKFEVFKKVETKKETKSDTCIIR